MARREGERVGSSFSGAGFTIAAAMASALPSGGVGDPAARLAVRGLRCGHTGSLGPGGEVGGRIAVSIYNQSAPVAAEYPLAQLHWRSNPPTP